MTSPLLLHAKFGNIHIHIPTPLSNLCVGLITSISILINLNSKRKKIPTSVTLYSIKYFCLFLYQYIKSPGQNHNQNKHYLATKTTNDVAPYISHTDIPTRGMSGEKNPNKCNKWQIICTKYFCLLLYQYIKLLTTVTHVLGPWHLGMPTSQSPA